MILKLRAHQQMRPIGGHHYISHGVKFEGDTLDEVIRKVKDYRLNNLIPVGDPKQEILMFYLRNWPFMVDLDEDAVEPEIPQNETETWVGWVRRQWMKPPVKTITPKEAETRWKICLGCPFNHPIEATTEEQMDIKRKAFLLRKGNSVPSKLGFCSLHVWDTPSAVFAEAPAQLSGKLKESANYPGCWVA